MGTGQPTLYGRDWNTYDTVEPWDPRKMQSASKEGNEWQVMNVFNGKYQLVNTEAPKMGTENYVMRWLQ